MSPASSGGVSANTLFTASTMIRTGSDSASRTSSEWRLSALGTPETMSRPLISVDSEKPGKAFPIATLICSAVGSPINRLYFRFTYWRIASSILSPGDAPRLALDDPPQGDARALRRPAADVDDHAPGRFGDGKTRPDGGRQRLLDEIHLPGARALRGLADGAALHFGAAVGDADDDAGPHEGARLVGLPDEVPEHRLGHLEIGDDTVLDGADRHDVHRREEDHTLRLHPPGEDLLGPPGVAVDGY